MFHAVSSGAPGGKWAMSSPNILFFSLLFSSLSATGSSFAVFMAPVGRLKGLQLCLLPRQWPGSLRRSCKSHVFYKSSDFSAGRRAAPHGRAPVCFLLSLHCLLQLPCYILLFCPLSISLSKKLGPLIQCLGSALLTHGSAFKWLISIRMH